MKLAICMAVFGRRELTDRVLSQIAMERHFVDVFLCDNAGDYESPAWVHCQKPGKNLGWLAGTNRCWQAARESDRPYVGFVLLNNDVVLSPDFFAHLLAAYREARLPIGILAPTYDDCHRFQYRGNYPATEHVPKNSLQSAPFVDGTCMFVARAAADQVGLLDEENFGFFGWGGDIDYCIRVRKVGFEVMVTDRAFLNHLGRATADHVFVDYKPKALQDFRLGMKRKYGRFWGRFQEVGTLRRTLKALRSSITSTQWFAALTMRTSRAN